MTIQVQMAFGQADIDGIRALSDEELNELDFGVIGFDAAGVVRRYNATEARYAGLTQHRVPGKPLFTTIAPCMNNFMVAQRFLDAASAGSVLDVTIDYVLTFKMRPSKVKLRLLAAPKQPLSYVLIERVP